MAAPFFQKCGVAVGQPRWGWSWCVYVDYVYHDHELWSNIGENSALTTKSLKAVSWSQGKFHTGRRFVWVHWWGGDERICDAMVCTKHQRIAPSPLQITKHQYKAQLEEKFSCTHLPQCVLQGMNSTPGSDLLLAKMAVNFLSMSTHADLRVSNGETQNWWEIQRKWCISS